MAFKSIVLFGVGGTNIGHHILHALVTDRSFKVTVLARQSSRTILPPDVDLIKLPDPFSHDDLVAALKDKDVVIATTGLAAHAQQYKLIDAAREAGVKRFIPSEWGMDNGDLKNVELCPVFKFKAEVTDYLRTNESETFSWTAVATSIWLDWALDMKFLGIDPINHTAQYWYGGVHTPSITTLPYCAQATLQVLRHPELFKNERVFLSPFQASQHEIVAELENIQGVKYRSSEANVDKIVAKATARWSDERDEMAAYTLVSAGVLLPGYGADFTTSGKKPLLERTVEMPTLSLKDTIKEWVNVHSETGFYE